MAQRAVKVIEAVECTPGRHRVTRHMHQQPPSSVEQGPLIDHFEHHDLLNGAPEQPQLPGHHQVTCQAQQLALKAHAHQQFQVAGIEHLFLPGLVPVHQHGIADCIDQQRLDAFWVLVGLEDGIQMTLIALAQVQLAAQCGKGDGGGEVVGACTRYQQPVADRLAARAGLFGSEVTFTVISVSC